MRATTLALLALGVATWPVIAASQEASCPGEKADKQLTVTYPLAIPHDSLRQRLDTVLSALGYSPTTIPSGRWEYESVPRLDWPLGTEKAPWRGGSQPPGVAIAVRLQDRGAGQTSLEVRATALCAVGTRKASRREDSLEHTVTMFAAMQVLVAFNAGTPKALHAFD